MTVSVANTNLSDSFNSWRLHTNFAATVISNNVVTVNPHGDANRGGQAVGNGHVTGTFTATEFRAYTLRGGNTSVQGDMTIASNVSISGVDAVNFSVDANTVFNANVDFNITGEERLIMPDVSRIRITGGTAGQFLRSANVFNGSTDTVEFKHLTFRDITDLTSNSSHITLSGANTEFSDNGDSTKLLFVTGNGDTAEVYLGEGTSQTHGDLYIKLVDAAGQSELKIVDSANSVVAHINSDGVATFVANVVAQGFTSSANILPVTDDSVDLGAPNREFRDLYIDGVANIDELSVATGSGQGVSTSLIPKTDAAGNLGSSTRKWGTVWADTTNGGSVVAKSLGVSGTLNANGAATLGGTLGVSGKTTTAGLNSTAKVTVPELHANGAVDFDSNLNVDGTITVDGAASFKGNVTLGNATGDTITVKGKFANQVTTGTASFMGDVILGNADTDEIAFKGIANTSIIPRKVTGVAGPNLGSRTKQWDEVHANTVYANTIITDNDLTIEGGLTVQGATSLASGQTFTSPIGRFTNVVVTDTASFEGTTVIGNGSSDDLTINARHTKTMEPKAGIRIDVGDSTRRWHNMWANTVNTRILKATANTYLEGKVLNGGYIIMSGNGKLFTNNAITLGSITNGMLANSNYTITVTDGGSVKATDSYSIGSGFQFDSGEGLSWTKAANNAYVISAENASTTNKGVAKFNSNRFSVSSGSVDIKTGGIGATQLASTLTAGQAGTFGTSTLIPQFTVDVDGRITAISNVAVGSVDEFVYTQANNALKLGTADGSDFWVNINAAGTTSGTTRGVASFDSGDFSVSSGHVSLKNASTGAVLSISGTTDEVNVSRTNGAVTIGQPDNVKVKKTLTTKELIVSNNAVIAGNLTVQGTLTSIDTETIKLEDNVITLNSNKTTAPANGETGGIEVERGTGTNVQLRWNETNDRWEQQIGSSFYNIPKDGEYDYYKRWKLIDGDGTGVWMTANAHTKFVEGGGIDINFTDTSHGSSTDPFDLKFTNTDKGSSQNIFKTVKTNPTGHTAFSYTANATITTDTNNDTLNFVEGNGIDVAGDGTNDAVSITNSKPFDWIVFEDGDSTRVTINNQNYMKFREGTGVDINWTDTSPGSSADEYDLTFSIGQSVATTADVQFRSVDVGVVSGVGANGQIRATNEIVAYYSDERLKDLIGIIPNALDKVNSINGYYYTANETAQEMGYTDEQQVGVSAQEVEAVLPEVIRAAPIDENYKTVQYERLVPLLIEAIKELSAEVEELKKTTK